MILLRLVKLFLFAEHRLKSPLAAGFSHCRWLKISVLGFDCLLKAEKVFSVRPGLCSVNSKRQIDSFLEFEP